METKKLAEFLMTIRPETLDEHTVDYAKMCVEDLIGVAIAGSAASVGGIWARYCLEEPMAPGAPTATCWNGSMQQAPYRTAAAYNAACGHLMDLDDLHNASVVHLAAVTIPAALALGQKLHSSGAEVLSAIVAGYEAGARVGEAINPEAYWFWHTTGVVGSFASAAAAAKLLKLDEELLLNALGNAGTQSAGLWEFMENGSMSKSLHTANATLCGLRAAELAKLGFTGAHTILEGKKGFVKALNANGHLHAITDGLGTALYQIRSNSFKPYACCRHTHSANACVQWMKEHYSIDPDQIASITDRTYQLAIDLADAPKPTTPYSYKFSIQYCIAAMLLYGMLDESVFTPERTQQPQIQALMAKIRVVQDSEIQKEFTENPNRWPHVLEIRMKDGQTYTHRVDVPPGDFMNPFSWNDADRKFRQITSGILPQERSTKLLEKIRTMQTLEDINSLFAAE